MHEIYSLERLCAIYELARVYFERGYIDRAERILKGVSLFDHGHLPSLLGLGLCNIENECYDVATNYFREVIKIGEFEIETKLALCFLFLASGDTDRATSLVKQIAEENFSEVSSRKQLSKAFEILQLRCADERLKNPS